MTDFSVLAQMTGIPKRFFEEVANGISMTVCRAMTVDEARWEYHKHHEGSDERRAALERWSGLSLYEIEQAEDLQAIKDACRKAPRDSEVERLGHIKWIRLCKRIEDVYEIYRISHSSGHIERLALVRMIELYLGDTT